MISSYPNIRRLVLAGACLAASLTAGLAARPAHAEQIVLFDITYTHTNANDSHHSISGAALNQPANWTSPIDYSKGTIHFYQEVMTKPSNKPTIIDFCLISTRDYGCIETFIYTNTGLHETVRSMAGGEVDKRNVIDFTQRMRSIQMVLKTPAPTWINGGRPQSDYLPSMMRFVATLVSPGGTYTRPTPTAGFNPGDGGASASPTDAGVTPPPPADATVTPPPPSDGAATVDAAVTTDAGSGTTPPNPQPDPPPAPKPDAASTPPSNPTPRPPSGTGGTGGSGNTGTPTRPATASGCSVGGEGSAPTGSAPLAALLLAATIAVRRRRRR